ncbi:hypothetical protein EDB19DRAFT_466873 [Suillus lakei]|nr:hypothetical protein EDB19DRAFT_466873 [Suillus lakei]
MAIPTYCRFLNFNDIFESVALFTVLFLAKFHVCFSEDNNRLRYSFGSLVQYFNWLIIWTQYIHFLFPDPFAGSGTLCTCLLSVVSFPVLHLFFWAVVSCEDNGEIMQIYGQVMPAVHSWMLVS